MKKIIVSLILLGLANVAVAHDEWTADDTKRQVAYYVLHTVDWGQTRDIAKNPKMFHELNPIIGEHPTIGRVNGYFVTTALIHTGIAYILPAEWRKGFQYVTIGVEAGVTSMNYKTGIRVNF